MSDVDRFRLRSDEAPDPWSPQARSNREVAAEALEQLAGSPAKERLVATIERYCKGSISGHAVLVSGHRGAGKTTAVLAAMREVYETCRAEAVADRPKPPYRPLMVRIHGPGLLSPPAKTAENEGLDPSHHSTLRCLEEMAAGLLPALIDEIRVALTERASNDAPEQAELVAHVLDELARGTISLATLRETYRRLGLLERGLFGRQAFGELTAINAAREAYQLVIGDVDDKHDGEQGRKRETERKREWSFGGERLAQALSPVAAAAVAAVGLTTDHWAGALAAAGVILASGYLLTNTETQSTKNEFSRKRNFTRDSSLDSLKRHMPLLIDRLREVGLPPVFVVDELDKLSDPKGLLDDLLRNLKSFVTERSLILFITDRDYYATLTAPHAEDARYGEAHTYFGEHVYVLSRPPDLHVYLRRVLGQNRGRSLRKRRDGLFLRLLLLARSRMHLYDLRRELRRAALSGELRRVASNEASNLGTRSTRYEIFFQLCIEWIIADRRCERESAADPFFAQVLYTELYRVRDRWRAGKDLRLSEDATRIEAALSTPRQRDLVSRALDELETFLRAPERLAEALGQELDAERVARFTTASDVNPSPDELEGALDYRSDDSLNGRSRTVAEAIEASDRMWEAALRPPLDPVLPRLATPRDYVPQVDRHGHRDDAPTAAAPRELQHLRALASHDRVRAVGFDRLWRLAAPGLEIPQLFDGRDGPLESDERNAIAAEHAGVIGHAFYGIFVAHQVITHVAESLEAPFDAFKALETALRSQTTPQARRTLLSQIIAHFCHNAGVSLTPPVMEALGREPTLRDDAIVLPPPDELTTSESHPPQYDEQREYWSVLLALRIVRSLDPRVAFGLIPSAEALDISARIMGWFGTLTPWESERGSHRIEFLDTRLEKQQPNQWPIVTWAELGYSPFPALRAVAAERLGQQKPLQEAVDALRQVKQGEYPAEEPRARLLEWLGNRLEQLPTRAPRIAILDPREGLSVVLPTQGVTTYVVPIDEVDEAARKHELQASLILGERPWPAEREPPPAPYAYIDRNAKQDEQLANGWVVLADDGTNSLVDILQRVLSARGLT